jgi:hypothetical protein
LQSDELEKLRQNSAEIHRFLGKEKAAILKHASSVRESLHHNIESRHQAIEQVAAVGRQALPSSVNFNFVVLDTPLFVLPTQDINLVSQHATPWNTVAKINAEWSTLYPDNGSDNVSFVFVWENPSEAFRVVNVESYLMVHGFCAVMAEGGPGPRSFWGDKYTDVDVAVELNILEYWNNPPTVLSGRPGQSQYALRLSADGGGIFGLGEYDASGVSGSYDVFYRMFLVPPQGVAVFEVALDIFHRTDGGFIEIDFASGDFEIMCPAVVMAVLM